MTGPDRPERQAELLGVIDAAQKAAGIVAARHRGDHQDAAVLLNQLVGEGVESLTGGPLLLAELSLSLYAAESGRPVQDCIRELCVQMESALIQAPGR